MDEYAEVIGDNGATEDYLKIAFYYEKSDSHFKTGVFYLKGKEYSKVSLLFLVNLVKESKCLINILTKIIDFRKPSFSL